MHETPQGRIILLVLLVLLVLLAGAFQVTITHQSHVLTVLPFAIFLLCPLLRVVVHGGHARYGSTSNISGDEP